MSLPGLGWCLLLFGNLGIEDPLTKTSLYLCFFLGNQLLFVVFWWEIGKNPLEIPTTQGGGIFFKCSLMKTMFGNILYVYYVYQH